jgi:hypothetical protein
MLFRHEKIAFTEYERLIENTFRFDAFRQKLPSGNKTVSNAIDHLLKHLNYFNIEKGGMLTIPPCNDYFLLEIYLAFSLLCSSSVLVKMT